MSLKEQIIEKSVKLTTDEYFNQSEDRKVVTPENIGGLIEYPALFKAMQDDRELRPALSEAMSTGRAMADFLGMMPEEFLKSYVIADGPVNPKTGKPYGTDSKAFIEWRATQEKTPVATEQFNLFGKMAESYNQHAFVQTLANHERLRNVILGAKLEGVDCLVKIDNLYVNEGSVFAVDVTTTSDLNAFPRTSVGLYYRERLALIHLVLAANGVTPPQVRLAAIEKSKLPRCGIFGVKEFEPTAQSVLETLSDFAASAASGIYGTRFEAPGLI